MGTCDCGEKATHYWACCQCTETELKDSNAALLKALKGLVAGIERAASNGIDLTGHVGLGNALSAIAKAEKGDCARHDFDKHSICVECGHDMRDDI